MVLNRPDVHLICINDFSSLTVCLRLLMCELAFTYVYIASCNLSAYTFVMCKIKATYLFTYLLTYRRWYRKLLSAQSHVLLSVSVGYRLPLERQRGWWSAEILQTLAFLRLLPVGQCQQRAGRRTHFSHTVHRIHRYVYSFTPCPSGG